LAIAVEIPGIERRTLCWRQGWYLHWCHCRCVCCSFCRIQGILSSIFHLSLSSMRQASHARVSVNSHCTAHLFFLPHVSIESAPYVLELVQGRHATCHQGCKAR
jgi:hypothetical protein